jgi:hypothetical protein
MQGTFLPTDVWSIILEMVPSVANHTKAHRRKVAEFNTNNPIFTEVLEELYDHVDDQLALKELYDLSWCGDGLRVSLDLNKDL